MSPDPRTLDAVARLIEAGLSGATRPFVLGLCGSQGSGKSTLAAGLADRFEGQGVRTAILSIDDLYRTRAEREALARAVHPLLRTRGVPGTHDVDLGLSVLAGLDAGEATALPRFDKAVDDRAPRDRWPIAPADTRLILFEGWCVGAHAQPEAALAEPVNDLERAEDGDGRWRRFVNAALAGPYRRLFARIDRLVLLAAPAFETVFRWRTEQEQDLRARTGGGMDDAEIVRFVRHYERVTRHILAEMPDRADAVIRLDAQRVPIAVTP